VINPLNRFTFSLLRLRRFCFFPADLASVVFGGWSAAHPGRINMRLAEIILTRANQHPFCGNTKRNKITTSKPTEKTESSRRLMSLDALRGFDMFWIIGADSLVYALNEMSRSRPTNFSRTSSNTPIGKVFISTT